MAVVYERALATEIQRSQLLLLLLLARKRQARKEPQFDWNMHWAD